MLVKDIMVRNVVTVSPLATIREAMAVMRDKGVKSLVTDRQNEHDAYGLVTYTTILKTIVAEEGDIDLLNVYDVCSKPVITVPGEMEARHVARMMVTHDIRRVIVTSDNRLEGIISMSDIVGAILEMVK
ncbi:MAG: CBS domain-containing protein [Ectothiorhodospiraceae bacterium]|nr:CBS domain-containing protein [Ectothiorhodospiraceae bacterium]MCH8505111.1 CBS domain-containing protein [Ectothiorhodospiraceae bacterium]